MSDDGDDVYDVEDIVNDRIQSGKKQYLIKWVGFPSSQNTWENEENIFCEELKRNYETKKQKTKIKKEVKRKKFVQNVTNEWGGVIKKVVGVTKNKAGTYDVEYVTFDGKHGKTLSSEMHIKAPIQLLKFYEEHLTFTE